ncbi:hypothetical protein FRB95_001816 [Tulasnella sp. JGI-2019a]|nr:hypothetical protein FRB95_001816 [Tulasnella sp. JGI-2019a]
MPAAAASTLPPVKRNVSKAGHKRGLSLAGVSSPSLGPSVPPAHDDLSSVGSTSIAGSSQSAGQKPAPLPVTDPSSSNAPPTINTPSPWTPIINPNPSTLFSALRSLYSHISYNPQGKGTIAPQAFVNKLKKENALFRSSMHQDAHEFLNFLLNKIVEDMEEENATRSGAEAMSASMSSMTTTTTSNTNISTSATSLSATPLPQPSPLVQSLFQGTLTNETRCLTCERVTSRSEPFLDLSLDIAHNNISLNQCLRGFSKSEMLTARNKFFCDECCSLVEAEKRMKIKTLPPILLLHLKRFKYQEDVGRYVKLSYRVAFPFELRLYNNTVDPTTPPEGVKGDRGRRPAILRHSSGMALDAAGAAAAEVKGAGSGGPGDPELLYRLFAVVVHIGGGPHHGHYVTLVKSRGDVWLLFDDDSVEVIKESDIPKYFGDSTFTMGSANATAANAGAGLSTSAKILAANPGPGPNGASTTGNLTGGAATAPSGLAMLNAAASALNATAAVTTGNSANATSMPSSTGMAMGTTPPVTPAAGTGTGYVLFYQAVDIDLRGLGLISAAMEAKNAVIASHTNGTPLTTPPHQVAIGQRPPSPSPSPVPVLVEEPAPLDGDSIEDERSTNANLTPAFKPQNSPSSESAFSLSSSSTSATPLTPAAPKLTPQDSATPKRGMSLEIPQPSAGAAGFTPPEDQFSPLILPPPQSQVQASGSSGGPTGFFKSLKHSASKPEHRSGNGFSGFGLGMSSPTPRVVHNRGRVSIDATTESSGPVTKSASSLPLNGIVLGNGHAEPTGPEREVVNRTPSPAFLRVPYERSKEKDKEKDKDKANGGGGGWFSSARKSVSRKARKVGSERSRERETEKERELAAAYQSVGTASAGTTVTTASSSDRDIPPVPAFIAASRLPPPSESLDPISPAPPITNGSSIANGYGGWIAGTGQSNGGRDGSVNGPARATGSGASSRLEPPETERRASEPAVEALGSTRREPKSDMRPLSMVEDSGMNGRLQRIKLPPPTSYQSVVESDDSVSFPLRAPSTPASPQPGESVNAPGSLGSLRIPSTPVLSAGLPTTPSPISPSRFVPGPRRSMTLNVGDNLTPGGNKDEEKQRGIMKRASRKMSLSAGGGIRLSGFGFGQHKDKDKDKDRS